MEMSLVERLRLASLQHPLDSPMELFAEAANEIERLQEIEIAYEDCLSAGKDRDLF